LFAQQGLPGTPHVTHLPDNPHTSAASAQAEDGLWQQGSPWPPQWQTPAAQTPVAKLFNAMAQVAPCAAHWPEGRLASRKEQQAPAALHVLPGQHGLPVRPQGRHTGAEPVASQTMELSLQVLPAQHGSPDPPQCTQLEAPLAVEVVQIVVVRSLQVSPAPGAPGQQGWPRVPQPHAPFVHVP
jgi:hypothetical protein